MRSGQVKQPNTVRTPIGSMLHMEWKNRFGLSDKINRKKVPSLVLSVISILVIYAIYLVILYFLAEMFVVGKNGLPYEFLVLATAFIMLAQLVASCVSIVRTLYFSGNNELLMRFPVGGNELFFSKTLFTYILALIVLIVTALPIYIIYGVLTKANVGYYFASIPFFLFITLPPFAIANLLAIPIMNLVNAIKTKYLLILALLIVLMVGAFAVYMTILKGIVMYLQSGASMVMGAGVREILTDFTTHFYPFNLYANLLYGKDLGLSIGITLPVTALLCAAALWVSKKRVYPTVLASIEREGGAYEKKTTEKQRSPFHSLLRKEFLTIFRSVNYSFQYLSMAIAAPVMVYFCNDLAAAVGGDGVGNAIIPGLTLMVVIIFVTMIVSFASTAISREGNAFYLSKIMPISYLQQVAVKLTLYFTVSVGSMLICCIVVGSVFSADAYGNAMTFGDSALIFLISVLLIVGLTAQAVRADIVSPRFEVNKEGELVAPSKNTSFNLFIGTAFAVLFGIFTMIFSFIPVVTASGAVIIGNRFHAYGYLVLISFLFAAAEAFFLWRAVTRRYDNIIPEV